MAPEKWRRPPPRDTGNGLQKCDHLGGDRGLNSAKSPDIQDWRATILARRYRLAPAMAAIVATLHLGEARQ